MPGYLCITHPFATLHRSEAFDLHVLGTPPAFILSQDQTLRKKLTLLRVKKSRNWLVRHYFVSYHCSVVKVLAIWASGILLVLITTVKGFDRLKHRCTFFRIGSPGCKTLSALCLWWRRLLSCQWSVWETKSFVVTGEKEFYSQPFFMSRVFEHQFRNLLIKWYSVVWFVVKTKSFFITGEGELYASVIICQWIQTI